jgi:Helix-turn-helix domain
MKTKKSRRNCTTRGRENPPGWKTSSTTRGAEILRVFVDAQPSWVPLPQILALGIAQFNARIFELRRRGFTIENRTETDSETDTRHSWFRLVNPPASCPPADPKAAHDTPPSKSVDSYKSATGKKRAADLPQDELLLLRYHLGGATR